MKKSFYYVELFKIHCSQGVDDPGVDRLFISYAFPTKQLAELYKKQLEGLLYPLIGVKIHKVL